MFNGKTHYKWPFSIAMLVYQRVYLYTTWLHGLLVSWHIPGREKCRQVLQPRLDASFDGLSSKEGLMFHGNFVGNTMVFFLDKFSFSVDFPRKAIEIRYGIYDTFFCFDWWQNKALAGKASCFETISDMEVSSHCSSQSKHPFHGMFGKFWGSIFTGPELVLFRTLESCLMSISWYFT